MRAWKIKWFQQRKKEPDPWQWQYGEDERPNYLWLKQLCIATLTFGAVYAAHISSTSVGTVVDDSIHYILTANLDYAYYTAQIKQHVPTELRESMTGFIHTTLATPADPLFYMTKPVSGNILSQYGWQKSPVSNDTIANDGITLESPVGETVHAAATGRVKTITTNDQHGKLLIIDHGRNTESLYGNLGDILVQEGEMISQGQNIARVGKSGNTQKNCLYFELRENGKAIDPVPRLKGDFPGERK